VCKREIRLLARVVQSTLFSSRCDRGL